MKAPTTQATETQVIERIIEVLDQIDRDTFLEIANAILGTEFQIEDIEWAE